MWGVNGEGNLVSANEAAKLKDYSKFGSGALQ